MTILIVCFFGLFFVFSIIGIAIKVNSILVSNNKVKIELYENGKLSTDLSNVYVGRLADTSVRSSVRYHKSLYKTNNDYEEYRNNIRKLSLP